MLRPLIRRPRPYPESGSKQRGFTMALVTVALVAIIGMAALSIDIGTLYQAKAEAQRAADAGALAAAQVISMSGITGDPTLGATDGNWNAICGGATSPASVAAIDVAQSPLNTISGVAANTVTVNYGAGSAAATNTSCAGVGAAFGVNPTVSVVVTSGNLPIFFARVFSLIPGVSYSGTGVSATASAEVFNPSNSSSVVGSTVAVQPRCVKPWVVPNQDPGNGARNFVNATTGTITNTGISPAGVIGETFNLVVDCGMSGGRRRGRACTLTDNPPIADGTGGPNSLDYVPGEVSGPSTAIAANSSIDACSEATNNDYTEAVAGCDQTTVYACGSPLANTVDLTEDPGPMRNDSVNGAQCLINSGGTGLGNGQDVLVPATYPFQIQAGSNSAVLATAATTHITSGSQISSSPSIVSLPIYDSNAVRILNPVTTGVTVVGFLQVFINSVNPGNGYINVTVMNVSGCGNAASGPALQGTSPVPVRLITPPTS